jgi:hypothetical protein
MPHGFGVAGGAPGVRVSVAGEPSADGAVAVSAGGTGGAAENVLAAGAVGVPYVLWVAKLFSQPAAMSANATAKIQKGLNLIDVFSFRKSLMRMEIQRVPSSFAFRSILRTFHKRVNRLGSGVPFAQYMIADDAFRDALFTLLRIHVNHAVPSAAVGARKNTG